MLNCKLVDLGVDLWPWLPPQGLIFFKKNLLYFKIFNTNFTYCLSKFYFIYISAPQAKFFRSATQCRGERTPIVIKFKNKLPDERGSFRFLGQRIGSHIHGSWSDCQATWHTRWNVLCGDKMGIDGTLPIMGKVFESDTIGLKE